MRLIREATSALATSVLLTVLGCSRDLPAPIPGASPKADTPRRGGQLTTSSFSDVRSLDPAAVSDGVAPQIVQAMFAGLVDYDHGGQIQLDLAEHLGASPDGLTYRFVIRQGVRFHDGEELTAEDVKRSVERALHPRTPNPNGSSYGGLRGYADYVDGKASELSGVRVFGRYVVTFELRKPDSAFLPLLAMQSLRPVCKSAGAIYAESWLPCGTGPFKLAPGAWERGREITLSRHEGYFRPGLPYLDSLRFLFQVNPSSQRFKFIRGEQDTLRDFLAPELLKFQADPRWKPYGEYETEKQVAGISMNTEMPPFDNIEFRRAIAAALDRNQLQQVRAAHLRPAFLPIPPGVEGFDATLKGQHFSTQEALEHMRRAGYPYDPISKKGGFPEIITYLTYAQSLDENMAQVVMQQLAAIGIRFDIRTVNYPTFMALRTRRGQTAFGPGFWQQDYPEAGSFLHPLFHSRSINNEESNNWSFYSNPRVDALLDRAREELDRERRKRIYGEAQELLCDEAPWAFTHYYRFFTQWHPYVRDYRPHPIWTGDMKRSWLDRALSRAPVAIRAFFSRDFLAKLLGETNPREGRFR